MYLPTTCTGPISPVSPGGFFYYELIMDFFLYLTRYTNKPPSCKVRLFFVLHPNTYHSRQTDLFTLVPHLTILGPNPLSVYCILEPIVTSPVSKMGSSGTFKTYLFDVLDEIL